LKSERSPLPTEGSQDMNYLIRFTLPILSEGHHGK